MRAAPGTLARQDAHVRLARAGRSLQSLGSFGVSYGKYPEISPLPVKVAHVEANRVPLSPTARLHAPHGSLGDHQKWRLQPLARQQTHIRSHTQDHTSTHAHRSHVIVICSMPPTTLSAFNPAHPSPKRKRDQAPPIPLLNTALRSTTTPPPASPTRSGSDSPRNAVADQLRSMSLASLSAIPMSPLSPTDDTVHKKPKLHAGRVDSGVSLADHLERAKCKSSAPLHTHVVNTSRVSNYDCKEVPETPEAYTKPRILSDIAALAQPTAFVSSQNGAPSTETNRPTHGPLAKSIVSRLHSPKKSSSPPPSPLTWQDSEITGHLADPSKDPDDDGTGLNGIGFRPTPAIAYVRAQKRKQQILDWKAREAREARAKRSERRRRGVGSKPSRETTVERELSTSTNMDSRRTVKFAD